MNKFRKLMGAAGLATALLFSPQASNAQEITAEHLALAQEFVELNTVGFFEQGLLQVSVGTFRTFTKTNPDIGELIQQSIVEVMNTYQGQNHTLNNQIALIYAVRFTVEELQQLLNFYESDIGKKVLETSQIITKETDTAIEVWTNNLSKEFVSKLRAVMKAKGYEI